MENNYALLEADRVTKGKIRFKETGTTDSVLSPFIESVYVPKATLTQIGWTKGKRIKLTIEVED